MRQKVKLLTGFITVFLFAFLALGSVRSVSATSSPNVETETSSFIYFQGEEVSFSITNEGNESIQIPDTVPYKIQKWTIVGWKTVYKPYALMKVINLEPGETRTWTWNQVTDPNPTVAEQVGSGYYRVIFTIESSTYGTVHPISSFFIL